jgi:uncharacterized protein YrrD
MSTVYLSQKLNGKSIISVTNGQAIGKVVDIMLDPAVPRVAALVTSKGGLLKFEREVEAIPGEEVQVWGQDVILVSRPDVIARLEELPGSDKWLHVSEHIKGRDVISSDGRRIGELNDVVLDREGRIIAYDLARVLIQGPVAQTKRIAARATRSLGQDVLIVDAQEMELIEQAEPLPEESAADVA